MAMDNKLGITDPALLSRMEEKISKQRAIELFDHGILDEIEVGTFRGLSDIHAHLFSDIYDFAGKLRDVNIAKGHFRFASCLYLDKAVKTIEQMPQSTFDEIVEKYVEMNVAHPFREGNGRSLRIWLDVMLKDAIALVVDWSRIDREDYLLAMERSPVRTTEIKVLLESALTDRIDERELFMKGIDASYRYEGYQLYLTTEIDQERLSENDRER
jgi:cell filamentation protein